MQQKFNYPQGWVFAIKTRALSSSGNTIYRVGRTARHNPHVRIDEFRGSNKRWDLVYCSFQQNAIQSEQDLLAKLRKDVSVYSLRELGTKYFACDGNFARIMCKHFCAGPGPPGENRKTGPMSWKVGRGLHSRRPSRRSARLAAKTTHLH